MDKLICNDLKCESSVFVILIVNCFYQIASKDRQHLLDTAFQLQTPFSVLHHYRCGYVGWSVGLSDTEKPAQSFLDYLLDLLIDVPSLAAVCCFSNHLLFQYSVVVHVTLCCTVFGALKKRSVNKKVAKVL